MTNEPIGQKAAWVKDRPSAEFQSINTPLRGLPRKIWTLVLVLLIASTIWGWRTGNYWGWEFVIDGSFVFMLAYAAWTFVSRRKKRSG